MEKFKYSAILFLTWSENSVLADMIVDAAANPGIVAPTGLEFKITDTNYMFQLLLCQKKIT